MNEKLKYAKLEGKPYEFLNEYFTHKYCLGYVKWGNFMLREYYQNFGDRITDLDVRPDDIWLCSFMKTGFPYVCNLRANYQDNIRIRLTTNCKGEGEIFLDVSQRIASAMITNEDRLFVQAQRVLRFRNECSIRYGTSKQCDPNFFSEGYEIENCGLKDVALIPARSLGSSWCQEMVWCVANECDLVAAQKAYHKRVTFLESVSVLDIELEEMRKTGYYPIDSIKAVDESPSPRFIKTHLPFPLLPKKLQENTTAKIIYTTRNPADTCISYHDFASWDMGYTGSFDEFCELFLKGLVPYGPFWDHVLSYWQKRENPNVLILKYENMKKDLSFVIRQVAAFLGKTLTSDQILQLCDHLSFDNMKKNPAVNREGLQKRAKFLKLGKESGEFMRVGKVGEWKRIMKPEIQERFRKVTDERFAGTGLTFE